MLKWAIVAHLGSTYTGPISGPVFNEHWMNERCGLKWRATVCSDCPSEWFDCPAPQLQILVKETRSIWGNFLVLSFLSCFYLIPLVKIQSSDSGRTTFFYQWGFNAGCRIWGRNGHPAGLTWVELHEGGDSIPGLEGRNTGTCGEENCSANTVRVGYDFLIEKQ